MTEYLSWCSRISANLRVYHAMVTGLPVTEQPRTVIPITPAITGFFDLGPGFPLARTIFDYTLAYDMSRLEPYLHNYRNTFPIIKLAGLVGEIQG